MKLKIHVPDNGSWPIAFQGQTVDVDITNITFPDGSSWHVGGDGYKADMFDAGFVPLQRHGQPSSLVDIIGARPQRVQIEF